MHRLSWTNEDDAHHPHRRHHRDVCLDGGSLFGRTASRIVSAGAPLRARRRAGHRRRDWKSDRRRARRHQPASSTAGPRRPLSVQAAAAPSSSFSQNHDRRGRPLRVPQAVQRQLHHHGGQAGISRRSVQAAGGRVARRKPWSWPKARRSAVSGSICSGTPRSRASSLTKRASLPSEFRSAPCFARWSRDAGDWSMPGRRDGPTIAASIAYTGCCPATTSSRPWRRRFP